MKPESNSANHLSAPGSASTPVPPAAEFMQETSPWRVDYDLHPLTVRGLEHYLEQQDRDLRFHIH